jgi:pyruvate dehydrogenase E2 component (dihydrolipoamide acetyltransferase)
MPALSPTMQAGIIGKWLLKEGDSASPGDALAEIETDKASMAFECTDDLVIAKLLVPEGAEVAVGAPIMVTVEEGEDISAFANFEAPAAAAAAAPATPALAPVPSTPPPTPAAASPVASTSVPTSAPVVSRPDGARIFASPLAKRLARDAGIDLGNVQGSGPNGRIIAEDVKSAPTGATGVVSQRNMLPQAHMHTGEGSTGVYSDFELSALASAVAARYTHAKQVVPHYYLSIDLNLEKLVSMRNDLGEDMSLTNFFVKAAASAMETVPDVNGSWMDTFVRRYDQVDINLVMGTGDGLITPVIRDVGGKGIQELSDELNALEDSLFDDEEGEVISSTSEIAPGTFSIHNLGMYGVKAAAPIVLPPQACALALGTITETVVPCPINKWKVVPMMTATLSNDHRVVDGAIAAQWLSAFKTLVENPVGLML